ncbi:hypothetical protein [Halomonas casei]|uniref:hypothetical protein n=1 Tax=Halomonas casei TaxID=2742613 RepID=UPI003CE7ACFB
MQLSEKVIALGRQQYDETTTDDNRAVRDPVITAFGMAMQLAGYRPVMTQSGCMDLRPCPHCPAGKSSYSARYAKAGEEFWACPICTQVTKATQAAVSAVAAN